MVKEINEQENGDQDHKQSKNGEKPVKMEICYLCHKEFDMNQDDASRYRYGKFPLCDYCAEFYGFYFNDPDKRKREKID
ncbi:MAG: hypothetical protein ABFC91_06745 [Methanobacteriaceae archaeon]